ncbi:helix-turn-helix domain-containing protein, partial [Salmonella enterica subsp. enterica]|nr:helix-turn-helix domain-containing protein [Salmonella enterica subsp. enterica]
MISHYAVCILALLTEMEDLRMTQN